MAAPVRTHGQQYEFVLYGSVSENNLPALLHRLRGLCDYATEGGSPFTDREYVLKIGGRGHKMAALNFFPAENQSSSAKLQVRQSLDQQDAPWFVCICINGPLYMYMCMYV